MVLIFEKAITYADFRNHRYDSGKLLKTIKKFEKIQEKSGERNRKILS